MNAEIAGQLNEAGILMMVGMGFVFAFLALLIGGIKLIEITCARFPGEVEQPVSSSKKGPAKTSKDSGITPQTLAAISAAVHQHRQSQEKQ